MTNLVVFDSLYGNTQKIAEAIQKGLGISQTDLKLVDDLDLDSLKAYNLVVIGSPTHGGMPTEKIQKLLKDIDRSVLKNKKMAAFDTSFPAKGQGFFLKLLLNVIKYAGPKIADGLKRKGANVLDTRSFWVSGKEGPMVEGEIETAEAWGVKILSL